MSLHTLTHATVGVGAAVVLAACAPKDNLVFFPPDDPKMNGAIEQARKTLPIFWAKVDAHDPAISDPLVKVGLPNTHDSLEHIWMTVENHNNQAVLGHLANDPVDLPKLRRKDEISVEASKITDWAYTKAGKQYGAFTVRVMAANAKPDERRELEQGLAPTPLEPDTH